MKIYILAFLLLLTVLSSFLLLDKHADSKTGKAGTTKAVFKSTDGGETWQDISIGLPANLRVDSIRGNSFFANDQGLYIRVGNAFYHSTPNATAPFWTKERFPGEQSSLAPGNSGNVAFPGWGVNLKKRNGTSVWSPVFGSSSEPRMRSVFETAGGAVFIGTDQGFFKTENGGKTWKHVYSEGWAGNMAESDGVLVSTSKRRMIRSTDNGESWELVPGEDGVIWDVKQIKGGFAAIASGSASATRTLRKSYDGGKTWQPIDAGLPDKTFSDSVGRTWNDRPRVQASMTSIVQVGESLFCTHPQGLFTSSDKGKTWTLLLPSVEGKTFRVFFSGNAIYAIPSRGGC